METPHLKTMENHGKSPTWKIMENHGKSPIAS
jgi:hypothetical protein